MVKTEGILSFIVKHSVALSIGLGILMLAGGVLSRVIFPRIIGAVVDWRVSLEEGNKAFETWRKTPVPMKSKVYIFDVLNAGEFMEGRQMPKVREIGPFVYSQYREREGINFSQNGEKVSYYERLKFYFEPSESYGSLNDRVTVPNVPIITIFAIMNSAISMMPLSNLVIPVATNIASAVFSIHGEDLFQRVTVRELLEGRHMSLLDTADTLLSPLKALGVKIPEYGVSGQKLKNNKYGVIWVRNDSLKGPYEVYAYPSNRFAKFSSVNGKSQLSQWKQYTACSRLSGASDGSSFGPLDVNESSSVRIFNDNLCRTLRADYEKDSNVKGIGTKRFRFARDLFSSYAEENRCFCSGKKYACLDGATDLGPCLSGAPVAVSYPHFLYADYQLSKRVSGLNPDDNEHRGYLDVEPKLGFTLRGSGRFQINVMFKPVKFVPQMHNLKATLLPYIWIDEGAEIDDSLTTLLKFIIYPIKFVELASVASIIFGAALFTGMGTYAVMRQNKRAKQLAEKTHHLVTSRIKSALTKHNDVEDDYEPTDYNTQYSEPNDPQTGKLYPINLLDELHEKINADPKTSVLKRMDNCENQRINAQHFGFQSSAHSDGGDETMTPVEIGGDNHTTIVIERRIMGQ